MSSTYSTIIYSSMIANTHRIHMSKPFQPDTQTDRAYNFASQRIHLKGDVNNNNSCYPYSTGHMCLDLSSPHDACQRRKIKKEQKENFDSLHKSKYIKVKDRPFAEGSRGCHALICLYAQPLSAKEHHVILPIMIAPFIMKSITFILCHHKFIQRSILSYTKRSNTFRSNFYCLIAPMATYLKDLTQSLGRYGGLSKQDLG